ncbi:MAG: serine hydrolase [Dehalococcoidia bacterium]
MSRFLAAAVVAAALVLALSSRPSQLHLLTAQEAEPAPGPTPQALPTEESPQLVEVADSADAMVTEPVEDAAPAVVLYEGEEEAPLYYGDYVRPQRAPPAPVGSTDELQARIDELLLELPGQIGIAVLRPGEVLFSRDEGRAFPLASVAKLFILGAYLDRLALEQRPPDDWEYDLLDAMIGYSDNDAAEYLWQVLGGMEAMQAFLNGRGFFDFVPAEDFSWGGSADTPTEVAAFISQLTDGTLLSPESTAIALSLLGQVTESQRWGITAGIASTDPDAVILLKDGWYPEDSGWLVNSAGTVIPSNGAPPYAIVILGGSFLSYEDGLDAVNEVATLTNGLFLRLSAPPPAIDDVRYREWLYPPS